MGACTLTNVWWSAVCEDALTLKGNGNAVITGGGATGAEDKVIQHNGVGTVTIDGFTVVDFGKLYRSCGNCTLIQPSKQNPSLTLDRQGQWRHSQGQHQERQGKQRQGSRWYQLQLR